MTRVIGYGSAPSVGGNFRPPGVGRSEPGGREVSAGNGLHRDLDDQIDMFDVSKAFLFA